MKNTCNIIRDLLPTYIEGIASADTREYVEEHLAGCEACRDEMEGMRRDKLPQPASGLPMERLQKRLRGICIRTIAFTTAFVLAAAIAIFAQLTQPRYLSCEEAFYSLSSYGDEEGGVITLKFSEAVTGYAVEEALDPDAHAVEYSVTAWTSIWDQLTSGHGAQRVQIRYDDRPTALYYVANDGGEDELLHAENYEPAGNRITLPRLALAYYLVIAAAGAALLIALRLLLRKWNIARRCLNALIPAPIAYVLAHLAVKGRNATSYHMVRDLAMIALVAVVFYCALVCLAGLIRMQIEKRRDMLR